MCVQHTNSSLTDYFAIDYSRVLKMTMLPVKKNTGQAAGGDQTIKDLLLKMK